MKIYLCIVAACLTQVLVSCEIPTELKGIYEKCGKELGVSEAEALKEPINYDDPKLQCFSACLMEKYGSMANGKVVVAKTVEYAGKYFPEGIDDSVKAVITECAGKANESEKECDVAGAFEKCFVEKYPPPK